MAPEKRYDAFLNHSADKPAMESLAALLKGLGASNPGLCLVTTRESVVP